MPPRKRKERVTRKLGQGASTRLDQVRATVNKLRAKLVAEAKRRKLDLRVLTDAKQARLQVTTQVNALRKQGQDLARQLKKALSDAKSREQARQQALAKIGELREELKRRGDELRQKSAALAKLVKESAAQALEIARSEAGAQRPTPGPSAAGAQAPPAETAPRPEPSHEEPPT